MRWEVLVLLQSSRLTSGSLLSSLMLACLPQNVSANPQNGIVAAGDATIVTAAPHRVDIVQSSERAIINWQGFSIDAGEVTDFQQPSASSVTLNRVRGSQASVIAGSLTANGTVMLVNPNGVVIGKTGTVDVAGLVATTANIRDDDFLAQRLNFNEASANPGASVVNEGRITIGNQGLAALVAPSVRNSGVIEARLGKVALGGAQTFSLDFQGDGLLSFSPGSAVAVAPGGAADALVTNTGHILATGGTVQLSASAVKGVVDNVINTSGLIEARTVAERDGMIILSGGEHGTVAVSGTLDVSSGSGRGGAVGIIGETIGIAGTALIDASGASGGGTVDIGHADERSLAHVVQIDRGARIDADAVARGDGGDVIIWSADSTNFEGSIKARGGAGGGDGGFVEISSRDRIGLSGSVDLTAPIGATGELLIDPSTLTIIDAVAGSGQQDAAAGDSTIAAGDGNIADNTISRGTLEALSGAANITLEATGLITINEMAGDLINLQTDASHSFTLRSTTTDGIRFLDPNTEIRTQGGDISLQALKLGELTNIGRLTSNGGDITLISGGLAQVANTIDAGAGNVAVTSLSNSIQSVGAAAAIGNSVSLSAAYGSVGASGMPINTSTGRLSVATGGNLFVANDTLLSQLDFRSAHTQATPFLFELTSPQLLFNVTDTGTDYLVSSIVNAGNLDLTFAGDRNVLVGDVNGGAGAVALSTTAGSILDDGDGSTGITGSDLLLSATGGIGAAGGSLLTAVSTLDATAGSGGGVAISNTAALNVTSLVAPGGTSHIQAAGTLTMNVVAAAGSTLSLVSTGGSIFTAGGPNDTIAAQTLDLSAAGVIGTSPTPIATSATTLNAAAAADIYASTTGPVALGSVLSAAGPVWIAAFGDISVDRVDATAAGAVTLTATEGSITASTPGVNVTANTFDFASTLSYGNVTLGTAATTIRGSAGFGGIDLTQTGLTTLENLTTTGSLRLASSTGNVVLGALQSTSATISAAAGSILDDANASTALVANAADLSAMAGSLGTTVQHLETQTPSLTLDSGGDIFVDSTLALETLIITNTHPTPGVVNTLIVDAPYLQFDVTDTGSQFLLADITGVRLYTLSFTGDQTSVLTKLYAAGSVSVRATQGDLLDDSGPNSANTRLTGSSISLTADHGSLGTAAPEGALETNTSTLSATTGGNIYINDITDLSNLTIRSMHEDPVQDYQFILTAPSLRFDITDSTVGYALANVLDATSLGFDFEGDRTITAGTIDTTRDGWVMLRSTAGAVLDDGVKTTQILGDTVSLYSDASDVGSAIADGYMDVIARQLQGGATAGSFTAALPYSANTTNSNAVVSLSNINAAGPVAITVDNGDLRVNDLGSDGTVTLTATNGAILGSAGLSAAELVLSASGAIGATTSVLQTQVDGSITATAAGGGLYMDNVGNISLLTASVAGPLAISGNQDIVAGAIDAGPNAATITADGSLLDDGNLATRVIGSSVALTAQSGDLGSAQAAIGVTTPELTLASGGDVYADDSVGLTSLFVSGTASSSSEVNSYSVAAPGLTLNATDDGSIVTLAQLANSGALNFGFSTQRTLSVGSVNTSAGTASLASVSGDIVDDGDAGTIVSAPGLTLSAGNSLGASGAGNALATDAAILNLTALRDFHVDSSAALSSLAIRSDANAGLTNIFGITAAGQTFTLSDNGSTHYLQTATGAGLGQFSFDGRKNLNLGTITASGAVSLATSGGTSSITMDGVGGSRITGSAVTLSTIGSSGGHIGTSGTNIAVGTPSLSASSAGNIYVSDNQALSSLAIRQTHPNITTHFTTQVAASGLGFSVTDGATVALDNISSAGLNFSYDTDRVVQAGTINVGLAGAVTLVGRAPLSTSQAIADDGNDGTRITAGAINLNPGTNTGYVGAGGSGNIDVTTPILTVRSTGDIYINNSSALDLLAVTASHSSSGDRTYAITAPGLTFSVADQSLLVSGAQGTVITDVTDAGLDFSFASNRTLQVVTIDTGGAGRVTLGGNIVDDNNDATRITAGTLTLNGSTAGSSSNSTLKELDTTVGTLHTNLTGQLYLIETDDLTLGTNSVASFASLTSLNGGFFSDGLADFSARSLALTANNASLGAPGTPLLLDARTLTLQTGDNIYVDSVVDLVTLNVTNTHAVVGANTLSILAPNLTFDIDDVGGTQFDIVELSDGTGIDFTFTGDREIRLGAIDVKGGNYLSLVATGGDIFDDANATTQLTGESITLAASGSIGRVEPVIVNTTSLQLTSGGSLNVTDNLDLSLLGIHLSAQPGLVTYTLDVPNLTFDVVDDGTTTTVNDVTDTTGLGFSLRAGHSQDIQVIDTQRHGTLSLYSDGEITGSGVGAGRITAASAVFETSSGGGIGVGGDPLKLSVPLLMLRSTGDIDIMSDMHIDRLNIDNRHGSVGTYTIDSPDLIFNVTDSAGIVSIVDITDTTGLDLTYSADQDFQIGTINLGTAGNLSLSATAGGIDFAGDGDTNTLISAVGVNISTSGGAIGTAGAGNELNIQAQNFSGYAGGGGARLDFRGPVVVSSITSNGTSELVNAGDISVGFYDANGQSLTVTAGGSILSGYINDASTLTLTANGGGIGTVSMIQTNSQGGTTTLNATAVNGGVALNEADALFVDSLSATGPVTLSSRFALSVDALSAGTGAVTLTTSEGSITGTSGANLITGSAVTLNAEYWQAAQSIGSVGTPLNTDTSALTLNARGNLYAGSATDLDSLTIVRGQSSFGAPGGALSVTAPNLTFNASDNGTTTTLTNITDATGLDFSLTSYSAIAVDTLNVGAASDVYLESTRFNAIPSITSTGGAPLITARNLTLSTSGGTGIGFIGTSVAPLRTSVATFAANSQNGGIYVSQSGPLTVNNVFSGGALSVTTTAGDLMVGTISYGDNQPLTLTSAARLLDDGVNSTSLTGSGTGAINLSAVSGIGTALAPFSIVDQSLNNINITVTGAGSAYLDVTSFANPLVNVTASNGSINITTAGMVTLANLVSATDAAGNGIFATTLSGDLGVGTVTAGALFGTVNLQAPTGAITALSGANSISAFEPYLTAANGIGTFATPLNVTGQNIVADTLNGDVYLAPTGIAVLGFVRSQTGAVSVAGTSDIVAANVISGSGGITLFTSGADATIYAGNVNAGTGALTLNAVNGQILDDGVVATAIAGGSGSFIAADELGTNLIPLQTQLTSLSATVVGGGGIYIDQSGDLALGTLMSGGGPIRIIGTDSLTGNAVITATGGPVTLTGTNGDVLLTGSISTVGVDPALAVVTVSGGSIAVGDVTSTGAQQYNAATTVTGNLSGLSLLIDGDLTLGGIGTRVLATNEVAQSITINGGIDGGGAGLSLMANTGTIDIGGEATNLASFTSSASQTNLFGVTTTGSQIYFGSMAFDGAVYTTSGGGFNVSGPAELGADAVISTSSGDVVFGSTLDGAHNLSIDAGAGAVTFANAIGATTPLDALTVNSGGLTMFIGAVTVASLATDASGSLFILPATMTTTGAQSYGEALTLNSDMTFTGTSVTFGGAVNGSMFGLQNLNVVGDAVFSGGAGGTVPLHTITVSGTAGVSGTMTTTDAQSYGGAISLHGDTVFNLGNGIAFDSTIDGPYAMTVNAGVSDVTFNQAVGGSTGVGDVVVNSAGITSINGTVSAASLATDAPGSTLLNAIAITTTGAQSYADAVTVGVDATLTATNVAILDTLDDAVAGEHAVTIIGDATLDQAVGDAAALGALIISGATYINGGTVTTAASQYYGALVLGADTILTGTTIEAGAGEGTVAGEQSLDVIGNAFMGNLGSAQALESISISGTAQLGGDVTTAETQTYNGGVTLQDDVVLTSGGEVTFVSGLDSATVAIAAASMGAAVAPLINGGQVTAKALTVNAGTSDVLFGGPVGSTSRLGDIIVNTGGATTFTAPVYAASVTTDIPGTVALNGGLVDTLGTQSYGEIVTLGADTVLTGTTVSFTQALDGDVAGERAVTINGDAVFNGAVGSVAALRSLAVSGTSAINGGEVITTGSQTFAGSTSVGADTILTSGGSVTFGSKLDAVDFASLEIAAPAGSITIGGSIGAAGPFDRLVLLPGQNATLGGSVKVNEFTATAGAGTMQFNGPLETLGSVEIDNSNGGVVAFGANAPITAGTGFVIGGNGDVHLASNVAVSEGPLSIGGVLSLSGPQISLQTNGDISFYGITGPETILTLAAGTGGIVGGSTSGAPGARIGLRDMVVTSASSAQLYGSLSNISGGGTAKFVKGPLFGPPFFFNDVPFGPLEFVDQLVIQTARQDANMAGHLRVHADSQGGEYPEPSQLEILRAPEWPEVLTVKPAVYRCIEQSACEIDIE